MTVNEMIEKLRGFDGNLPVVAFEEHESLEILLQDVTSVRGMAVGSLGIGYRQPYYSIHGPWYKSDPIRCVFIRRGLS